MKKYITIIKCGFLEAAAYRSSFFTSMIGNFIQIIVLYYVWKSIFNYQEIVNGYSWSYMSRYVFISFLCNSALSFGFEMQTANKIIDGDIILDLLKPIKYRTMLFFKVIGNAGIEFIITLIVIGTTYLFLIGINSLPIMRCLLFIISLFLGQGVKFHIQYLCSLLCFYTDNSYGILKCREVLTNFLSGALIPLALFPSVIQDIISVFPFPSIVYIPSSIFLGAFTFQESVESILFQLLWNVILFIIGSIVWKRAISVISLYGG